MTKTIPILAPSQLNTTLDPAQLGGKGANLAALQRMGCPVPGFVIIPCAVYRSILHKPDVTEQVTSALGTPGNRPADAEATVATVLARHSRFAIPGPGLAAALENLGDGYVAVRSSADVEDTSTQSCAGMLSSFLYQSGVSAVESAIVRCWASPFSANALTYLDGAGIDPLSVGVAVVIQQMVDAYKAGVAFTCNPTTGKREELVIDAVFGLGEGLVSGAVEGDHLIVDKNSGVVIETRIGDKRHRMIRDQGGGLVSASVPDELRREVCLADTDIDVLAQICRTIEDGMGAPQDVEWAMADGKVAILQSRPITTLPAHTNVHIWDNANITESYGGITLPMTFSIVNRFYHAVFKASIAEMGVPGNVVKEMDPHLRNMLGLLDGRVYYNLISWYNMLFCLPAVRHYKPLWEQALGLKESLPDYARDAIRMTEDSPSLRDRMAKGRVALKLARIYPRFQTRVDRFIEHIDTIADDYAARDLSRLDTTELVAIYRDLEQLILHEWVEPNINDVYCFLFVGALKELANRWLGDDKDLYNDLIAGGDDIISLQPAARLQSLADEVWAKPPWRALFGEEDDQVIVRTLETDPAFGELSGKFEAYIQDFGFRTMDELKFESPDLYDDPGQLVVMIKNACRTAARRDPTQEVAAAASQSASARAAARRRAEAKLGRLLTRPKRIAFSLVLAQARRALRNRENTRFLRTKMFGLIRRILRGAGHDLARRGVLAAPRDLFYLSIDELFALVDGTAVTHNLKALVALRKQEYEDFRSARLHDRFVTQGLVYTDNDYLAPSVTAADHGQVLHGISGSAGQVRGYVKVITSPEDDLSLDGHILVAERTDPGWVTLYPSISGLLIERGSIVSHSVIVARELRIPTVVSVPHLTQVLQTGDYVEVDATRGTIRRLAPESNDQRTGRG